jgi:surface antigen
MNISTLSLTLLVALALLPACAPDDPKYVGHTGKKWAKDYGVVAGRCNAAAVGAVLGERRDRPVAIIVGTAIGAIIGHKVGQQLEERDRGCMGHALELAAEKKAVVWTNKVTGVTYQLTPTRDYTERGVSCREFTTRLSTSLKKDALKGKACRRGNGDWEFRT